MSSSTTENPLNPLLTTTASSTDDPLDSLLSLEDQFFDEGFRVGTKDGVRAGYEEGNVFAVEKGYEKFMEMGHLYGKAIIWAKRLPGDHGFLHGETMVGSAPATIKNENADDSSKKAQIQPLPVTGGSRLEKHIAQMLHAVDPTSLPYENTEEGVNEFDDRLKRAAAKAKLIERIVGEHYEETEIKIAVGTGNIEDIGNIPPRLLEKIE
ncbi:hypothetical protein AAP_03967 [Ascosphaera apis ARSEF 7405]|uniref:Essential protein Yae1 N-terminal domain-containing protein n=1 Tax=Ascosphaera apis ARSEF 7405 TaxID=392613 RepID=A0A167XFC7_9EURO|nr:hypothetical protein AAP_03967 [Ascosphaera apis ARSEF 7405]